MQIITVSENIYLQTVKSSGNRDTRIANKRQLEIQMLNEVDMYNFYVEV